MTTGSTASKRTRKAATASERTPTSESVPFLSVPSRGPLDRVAVMHNMLLLGHKVHAPFSTHLEEHYQITLSQFRVLTMIGRFGTTASHEVSVVSGLNPMGVSRAVSALIERGWIKGTPDPRNKRRVLLELTKRGRDLHDQMLMPSTRMVAEYLFEEMSDSALRALNSKFVAMIQRVEARDDQGNSKFLAATHPDSIQR